MTKRGLSWAVALIVGCGGKTAGEEAAPIHDVDRTDARADVAAPVDTSEESGVDCAPALDRVAAALTGKYCTTTVAVNVDSSALVGWTTTCGDTGHRPTEDEARATFAPFTRPAAPAAAYMSIGGSTPSDAYVFYLPPADTGGLAIVSATRGELLFFADLVSGCDSNTVRVPAAWRSPAEVRGDCESTPLPRVRYVVPDSLREVDEASTAGARAAVESSAIVRGISRVQVAVDTMITRLSNRGCPTMGPNDRFILTIDSGRLE